MTKDLDLVARLSDEERAVREHSLRAISPDDGKYSPTSMALVEYLSVEAEWRTFAYVQRTFLEARVEFGKAEQKNLDEVDEALKRISPLNMALLEELETKHDQLAVLEEIGRYVSEETKALLHPGTTSYDIVDSARSYLFRKAWKEVIRPEIEKSIVQICELSNRSIGILQTGRTHLKNTSPVLFGASLAGYAARLANRVENCDLYFKNLKGKASGIVGTGASIDMVIGEGKSLDFEEVALKKLGLEPDMTATQVVQKETLADLGNGLVTLMHVLGDFANDIRLLYSSGIGEVTSRDNAERLGGSSADATKNNPINYENIAGKVPVVESGMRVLYELISTDLQRDLRGSVQARYQPQPMMAETYESFTRLNKVLKQLSLNEDVIAKNLESVRNSPGEAMVAILRGQQWIHPEYGVGHNFVKKMGILSQKSGRPLLEVSLEDSYFRDLFADTLSEDHRDILRGKLEKYTGSSVERANRNITYAKSVVGKQPY